jgi:hypothetical protein
LQRTLELRPDLLEQADLTPEDLAYLRSLGYKTKEERRTTND